MLNSPKLLVKGLKTDFARLLATTKDSAVEGFIQTINSQSDKEEYNFFDALPSIKEWVDRIDGSLMKDFLFTVRNIPWQNSILVDRFTLEDSKSTINNNLQMWVNSLPQEFKNFKDKLINTLLTDNDNAFDGTSFFSDTRTNIEGSDAIDNIVTGTGDTLAQLDADIDSGRQLLRSMKDRNGNPFNTNLKVQVYAPIQLETKLMQLQNSETVDLGSGAITNRNQGTFELVVNEYQATSNDDWYMINVAHPFKPFIWQKRQEPTFKEIDKEDDKWIKFFVTARSNAAYGNPMAIVKINN